MKKVLSVISMALVIAVMLWTIGSSAASGPNTGWLDPYNAPGTATAHVQHQASYLDNGRHAMQGRVRVIIQDEEDNISYTSFAYTVMAPNENDNTLRSTTRSCTLYAGDTAFEQHSFYWVSGYWGE